MSSWMNRSANTQKRQIRVPNYSEFSITNGDIYQSMIDLLAVYIFNQKMGERSYIYDSLNFLSNFINQNPQLQILKELPDKASKINVNDTRGVISNLKFLEVQRNAGSLFVYRPDFNGAVLDTLQKNGIRSIFDIGVHLVPDASGSFVNQIQFIHAYQQKTKKPSLTVFLASNNPSHIQAFTRLADPTWKISHVHKVLPKTADEHFIARMAEVQVLTTTPALILDYEQSFSRFVHLMHRNMRDIEYLKTVTPRSWSLI